MPFQSSLEEYLALLLKSGLATRDWLAAMLEQYRAIRGAAGDVGSFARWLIEQGHLTPWQHRRLLDGKTQGFFLGKYKILSHLGSGGMSEVYLGEHTMLRRRVAIKVLAIDKISSDSSVLQRFLTEAQAIASLDHKNIVRAYNVDKRGRVYYIAMEYVAGEDLQRRVEREGPLAIAPAVDYAAQAAEGLAHAHAKGFVHRDVKPANLLVDSHGTVKILDLGLAKLRRAQGRSLTMEYNDRILGTVDYMAPEQALHSHQVDGYADVYGLGCTMFFLLAGRPPFPNGTIAQRMVQHLHGNRPSLFDARPDAPAELVRICHRMMAREPRDRITTSEAAAALHQVVADLPKDGSANAPPARREWVTVDVGADTKISQGDPTPASDEESAELDEISSLLASLDEDREVTSPSDPTHSIARAGETTLADGDYKPEPPPAESASSVSSFPPAGPPRGKSSKPAKPASAATSRSGAARAGAAAGTPGVPVPNASPSGREEKSGIGEQESPAPTASGEPSKRRILWRGRPLGDGAGE